MKKYSIKQILLSNQNWWRFYEKNKLNLRTAIVVGITKLLSCKNAIRGFREYHCQNCFHTKYINFTCKCKACSSCGKKATEQWIAKQNNILPNTSWQHITFTMPSELWDLFCYNRKLLNLISSIAANCLQKIAKTKGIILGIFIVIHTFGRQLTRNIHIHLSTTTGGLTLDLNHWKKISFSQTTLMTMWRYEIIKLFRETYKNNDLIIPAVIKERFNHDYTFNHFLNELYEKQWIVSLEKPTNNYKLIVNYLGRYFKRPPIAESKLKHYDGNEVTFKYLDP